MLFDFSKNTFGLDISERALRLVQLKKKGKNLTITSFNEIKLKEGTISNGEIQNPDKLAEAIHQLIKKVQGDRITTKNVIAVLPEPKTFIKVIDVPNKEGEELTKSIKKEIKNHIPLELEEIYLDWQIIKQKAGRTKILVGATTKNISDSYFAAIKKAGLTPLVLEIEAIAIIRALINEKVQDHKQAKIIIDFGAVRTGLIVYSQGMIQFTVSLPISGNKITALIAENLKLDFQQAEKAKMVRGLDQKKGGGDLLKILLANIDNLSTHIKKSIIFYKTNFSDNRPISEIILCGGGANLAQVDKVISEKLQLPVKIGNPSTNLGEIKKLDIPKSKLLSYTTAIGLALRAWQKEKLI